MNGPPPSPLILKKSHRKRPNNDSIQADDGKKKEGGDIPTNTLKKQNLQMLNQDDFNVKKIYDFMKFFTHFKKRKRVFLTTKNPFFVKCY